MLSSSKEKFDHLRHIIPAAAESAAGKEVIQLDFEVVAGHQISLIERDPQSHPGEVEIHLFGASAKNSPFVLDSIDLGREIFAEIIKQLENDSTDNLNKVIARAKQAVYSRKKRQR